MAEPQEDPVVTDGRREALLIFGVWVLATAWSVGFCYFYGYNRDTIGYQRSLESLRFVLGFPDWIFWGVVLPWWGWSAFAWWFSSRYMQDHDLGEDPEGVSDMAEVSHG